MSDIPTKLEVANAALHSFAPDTEILPNKGVGGWQVRWHTYGAKPGVMSRRWQTLHGQDFYPVWHNRWPHGGTASTALSQLIRWLQGRSVLPIDSWRYWASEKVRLVSPAAVDALVAGGYPLEVKCVLCGCSPKGLDWWHLNGVSGPCCGWTAGCRQEIAPSPETPGAARPATAPAKGGQNQ